MFRDWSPFSSSPSLRLFDWRSIGGGNDIGEADDHDRERVSLTLALSNDGRGRDVVATVVQDCRGLYLPFVEANFDVSLEF